MEISVSHLFSQSKKAWRNSKYHRVLLTFLHSLCLIGHHIDRLRWQTNIHSSIVPRWKRSRDRKIRPNYMVTIYLQKVMISGELSNNHTIIKLIHNFSKVESRILLSLEDHCFSMFKEKLHIKKRKL